jgi:hypothetical protein
VQARGRSGWESRYWRRSSRCDGLGRRVWPTGEPTSGWVRGRIGTENRSKRLWLRSPVSLTALSLGSCPQPQTSRGIVGLSSSAFGGCRHAWRNRTLDTASEVSAPLAQLSSSRAAPGSSRSGRARRDRWPSSKGCRHCRHAADAAAVRVGGRQAPCAGVWPVLEQGWLWRRSRSPPQRPVTEIPHTANPRLRAEPGRRARRIAARARFRQAPLRVGGVRSDDR